MALGLRRVWRELALSFPSVLPSRCKHTVGTRIAFFEAQFPARRCLCLCFTRHLAAPGARLEVEMVRYSFLVGSFIPDYTPVYPNDCTPLQSRLGKFKSLPILDCKGVVTCGRHN